MGLADDARRWHSERTTRDNTDNFTKHARSSVLWSRELASLLTEHKVPTTPVFQFCGQTTEERRFAHINDREQIFGNNAKRRADYAAIQAGKWEAVQMRPGCYRRKVHQVRHVGDGWPLSGVTFRRSHIYLVLEVDGTLWAADKSAVDMAQVTTVDGLIHHNTSRDAEYWSGPMIDDRAGHIGRRPFVVLEQQPVSADFELRHLHGLDLDGIRDTFAVPHAAAAIDGSSTRQASGWIFAAPPFS